MVVFGANMVHSRMLTRERRNPSESFVLVGHNRGLPGTDVERLFYRRLRSVPPAATERLE
jgi:hypothetical protein